MNEEREREYHEALKNAVEKKDYRLAASLKGWEESELGEEFMKAVRGDDLEEVKKLLEKGADVNYQDTDGDVALGDASFRGHLEIVKHLLEKGSDVNHVNYDGVSVLALAVFGSNWHIVKILFENGVLRTEHSLNSLNEYRERLQQFPIEEVESLIALIESKKESENE